jgi:glycine/D-amino acid oxidase-like deaminating enzyme
MLDRGMEEIVGATLSPHDGLLNPNAVRRWYRREAERCGVRFLDRHYVAGVETLRTGDLACGRRRVESVDVVEVGSGDPTDESGEIREILTTHRVPARAVRSELRIRCEAVVNCLGAWSPVFSAKVGVSDVTEPVRRQICLVDVRAADRAAGVDFDALGMIVDASGVYFHPEGPHILAGYSIPEEAPGFDFHYDGREFFETFVWPRLARRASSFERCGHVRGWAGLYAVTPDRSGIAGAVTGFDNLFEAHSFTGRGVMQSYGIATALAETVISGRSESIDLSPLARDRFADRGSWVIEDLHI